MSKVVNPSLKPTYFIPKYVDCIEYIADKLFVSSFILNKLKDLPIGLMSPICTNLALILLALAFSLQILSSLYYQTPKQKSNIWTYRNRALWFNLIGALTAWTCIMFPEIWLICTWILCFNNLLWIYNEESRLEIPTIYPQMPKNQYEYCKYVVCIGIATFISATSNTFHLELIGKSFNWIATGCGLLSLWQSTKTEPTDSNFGPALTAF